MSNSTITDLPQYSDPTSSTDRPDESQSESQPSQGESQSKSQPSHDEASVTLPDPWAAEDGVIDETIAPQTLDDETYPPYQDAAPNVRSQLTEAHYKHLCDEGFQDYLDVLLAHGIRSITKQEAGIMGFWASVDDEPQTTSGLLFPLTKEFVQLRPDDEGFPKYFGRSKVSPAAYVPVGCKIITEGLKDAFACDFFGGIPTGAIAGVGCFSSALPKDSGLTLLFDSDGWWKPGVFEQLIKGGKHVGGKVQLIPPIPGKPTAGGCEYFKSGYTADDFAALIAAAMSIEAFMFELPKHWSALKVEKLYECADKLTRVACECLSPRKLEALWVALKEAGVPLGVTRATIKDFKQGQEAKQASEREKGRREKAEQSSTILIEMKDDGNGGFMPPGQGNVATAIATALKDHLAYDPTSTKFFKYESEIPGIWSAEIIETSHQRIAKILDENGAEGNYAQNFVSGVHLLMRGAIVVKEEEWGNDRKLIPFRNGVLNIEEGKLLPHDPEFRLCWALPFDYDQGATCESILEWLLEVNSGYADRVQLCRAWLKAVLTGGSRFQKFLYLMGPGGSGKSSFMNLVEACLGAANVVVSDLLTLENNRFETANLRNKRLLCIPEAHKFAEITTLKNITGQSALRYELKGIQAGNSFIFGGMVMLSGNEDLRSNESTSALTRRKILLPFSAVCPDDRKRDLIGKDERGNPTGEFAPYLAGLINWALEMSDSDMAAFLSQTARMVPSIQAHAAESLTDTNPIAAWLDECCFAMADAKTYIGKINQDKDIFLKDKETFLYPSYADFCLQRGHKPITLTRYSGLLLDLLNHQLKIVATKGRDNRGAYIRGIGIRAAGTNEPRIVTEPPKLPAGDDLVMGSDDLVMGSDDLVTTQTLTGVESDDCDDLSSVTHDGKKKEKSLNDLDQPLDEPLSSGETLSSEIIYFPDNIQGVEDSRHSRHSLHPHGFKSSLGSSLPVTNPSLPVTSESASWLSAENIEGMIQDAKDFYEAGTPELIESCLIAAVPSSLQDQVRKLITDAANPFKQAELLS